MSVFIKKKEMTNPNNRRCLNCGKDISNKRKDAKFCCQTCYNSYHGIDFDKYNLYLIDGGF